MYILFNPIPNPPALGIPIVRLAHRHLGREGRTLEGEQLPERPCTTAQGCAWEVGLLEQQGPRFLAYPAPS